MVVSFAVSDPEFMRRLLGFLLYPQRLNVAVTRGRTKVVLVFSTALREWLAASGDEDAKLAASLLDEIGVLEMMDGTEEGA